MRTTLNPGIVAVGIGLFLCSGASAASLLAAKNGMTLYIFDNDKGGVPSCYDSCSKNWPAYLGKKSEKMEKGWSLVSRKDGRSQWAYDGKPVYFYYGDKKKGDKSGDGVGGIWHVVME